MDTLQHTVEWFREAVREPTDKNLVKSILICDTDRLTCRR